MGALQIILIVLKVTGLTEFTWLQVFIPTLISIGASALLIIAIVVMVIIDQWKYHSCR